MTCTSSVRSEEDLLPLCCECLNTANRWTFPPRKVVRKSSSYRYPSNVCSHICAGTHIYVNICAYVQYTRVPVMWAALSMRCVGCRSCANLTHRIWFSPQHSWGSKHLCSGNRLVSPKRSLLCVFFFFFSPRFQQILTSSYDQMWCRGKRTSSNAPINITVW